jgi:hypothetical protein
MPVTASMVYDVKLLKPTEIGRALVDSPLSICRLEYHDNMYLYLPPDNFPVTSDAGAWMCVMTLSMPFQILAAAFELLEFLTQQ